VVLSASNLVLDLVPRRLGLRQFGALVDMPGFDGVLGKCHSVYIDILVIMTYEDMTTWHLIPAEDAPKVDDRLCWSCFHHSSILYGNHAAVPLLAGLLAGDTGPASKPSRSGGLA
jgi:hypothetical protein